MNSALETSSSIKGMVMLPVLSAFTFASDGTSQLSILNMDYTPTVVDVPYVQLDEPSYNTRQNTRSSQTIIIDSDGFDLLSIKEFAKNYLNNLTPIDESIQAVIDDYFWEML